METLVRRLVRRLKTRKTIVDKAAFPQDASRMDRLERAVEEWVARKGYWAPTRTVTEVAGQLDTDSVLLYHYFQDRLHTDFRTWRTRLRLEDAMRLLLDEPDTYASDIARRVGFSNRSNFARQFLAYTGMTPGQWRERARTSPDVPAQKRL